MATEDCNGPDLPLGSFRLSAVYHIDPKTSDSTLASDIDDLLSSVLDIVSRHNEAADEYNVLWGAQHLLGQAVAVHRLLSHRLDAAS